MSLTKHETETTVADIEAKYRPPPRRQSADGFSGLARLVMLSNTSNSSSNASNSANHSPPPELILPTNLDLTSIPKQQKDSLKPPPKAATGRAQDEDKIHLQPNGTAQSHGRALTDTPLPSAPGSPHMYDSTRDQYDQVLTWNSPGKVGTSGISTPKIRATTLDIPGLTRSKVSPDGRISERDVGAKLIIIMVGLPARGKSYIVKKIARYLNWLQHPTRIFNVGDRRRVVGGKGRAIQKSKEQQLRDSLRRMSLNTTQPQGIVEHDHMLGPPALSTQVLINDEHKHSEATPISPLNMNGREPLSHDAHVKEPIPMPEPEHLQQDSTFFDPENEEAKRIREQVAHDTMDELLQYVLRDGGSVGILDATNHTQERRMSLIKHLKSRNVDVNVLFLESRCEDRGLLEANMRLKLSGPDYKDKDPVKSLEDFQQRVAQYEKKYEPLGDFEEENDIPYCSMIDVGRKMVSYRANGFLSVQTISYLMNFNLAPRQIWLTRHGESMDNVSGKIGGDSHLSPKGVQYAKALEKFIVQERSLWVERQIEKQRSTHFPPRPGDTTPPNPEVEASEISRAFCVWTSMLNRSIETTQFFSEDEFDIKQMRMLDELNAGSMEGMTYEEIRTKCRSEYELRKKDKLQYRYPGPGGEGYLDIISRLRKVILEIERMQDHVLLVGHRSITRVLLAYFLGLKQEDISDLDVPLGVAYMIEPRPYGVEFKAYRWNQENDEFVYDENYRLRRAVEP
ncbi:6-phosphofructo-2-kinase [Exophiala xenobiotica]|uniref:6-phosphofructo-2-kinase n=1 Tax=Lithohypha guttulata TaxID=1690604 RepID=A0ABR0KHG7_9EURO|nr:6-phosphofructo-2-kinase [Lithohypha guttulata]KAK5322923.1 6-phosphofructo-2-kinase [Exophiala xenobiotica]